jgi:hypothetical protein
MMSYSAMMRKKAAALYAAIDAGFIEDPGLPSDRSWLDSSEDVFSAGVTSLDLIDSAYANLITVMNERTGTTLFSEDGTHPIAGMYSTKDGKIVYEMYDGTDYAANTDNIDAYFADGDYDGETDYANKYKQTKKDAKDA